MVEKLILTIKQFLRSGRKLSSATATQQIAKILRHIFGKILLCSFAGLVASLVGAEKYLPQGLLGTRQF